MQQVETLLFFTSQNYEHLGRNAEILTKNSQMENNEDKERQEIPRKKTLKCKKK